MLSPLRDVFQLGNQHPPFAAVAIHPNAGGIAVNVDDLAFGLWFQSPRRSILGNANQSAFVVGSEGGEQGDESIGCSADVGPMPFLYTERIADNQRGGKPLALRFLIGLLALFFGFYLGQAIAFGGLLLHNLGVRPFNIGVNLLAFFASEPRQQAATATDKEPEANRDHASGRNHAKINSTAETKTTAETGLLGISSSFAHRVFLNESTDILRARKIAVNHLSTGGK